MSIFEAVSPVDSVKIVGLEKVSLPFTTQYALFDRTGTTVTDSDLDDVTANDSDKYYVKSVTGLEPPDRDVAIAATASGGKYQGSLLQDREIVMLIGLNPDYDAGETPKLLRDNLYTMVHTGYDPRVDIQLFSGPYKHSHVYAYVTKFEADIFSKDPVVQLTFACLNPTFRAFDDVSYPSASLSETAPNVYNPGTAETGFQFAVKFTGTKNGWFIKQQENQNIGMLFDMTFHAGDVLAVSTIPGSRYVHWNKHRGKVQNKLGILTSSSEWVQLHPGNNHFTVPKKASAWDWHGKLTFSPRYLGV